ncbi:MAG: hypothetical protein JJ896_02815 [Rhodothermales bacterium]|nr:hypothetical protein [Rhodothermales bacterium]MBO6778563.1 hypothetical protein [Rhodothermales bacterium]
MANPPAATVQNAINELARWRGAFEARAARRIRRSQLMAIQQDCLTNLAAYRFQAPNGSDFRQLMSNIALIASREERDRVLEAWLYNISRFLQKQLRARDPFNWKGESKSFLYGLEMALPRKEWPQAFSDK